LCLLAVNANVIRLPHTSGKSGSAGIAIRRRNRRKSLGSRRAEKPGLKELRSVFPTVAFFVFVHQGCTPRGGRLGFIGVF
ncbi:MAG TPA: hypothetical protein VKP65_25320, partial [Rhodothermales bacterium]|nr:hypothetical protein [Rhodothermales bacterium]